MVALLLEHGGPVNKPDADRRTSLHLAVEFPNSSILELLLRSGRANLDAADDDGHHTPLMRAVIRGQCPMVAALLEHGASVNCSNSMKRTPLIVAEYRKRVDLVQLLLEASADRRCVDETGLSALKAAVQSRDTVIVRMISGGV